MTIEMKAKYKGHEISINSGSSDSPEFTVSLDGVELKTRIPTLKKCEEYIDRRGKEAFKRVKVFYRDGWRESTFKHAEATSIIDNDEVWLVTATGKGKELIDRVYLDNPSNLAKVKEMEKLDGEIRKITLQITGLVESLEKLTPEMMREEKK